METQKAHSGRRIPIRKRVLLAVLALTLTILTANVVISMIAMGHMMQKGETMLSEELCRNLSRAVEQKANQTNAMLDAYQKYLEVLRDYTENMYREYDNLVSTGRFVDSSRASTGEGVYALQSGFASPDYDLDSYREEMAFFSHLEYILEPMAKDNEEQISTIYLGTQSGMLISYDRWSTLSAVPEPEFFVYDYTQSEWYRKGLSAEGIFFTSLYVDATGRGLTITVATPFRDTDGTVQGVLAADFDITGLYREMISMDLGEGASSLAIDEENEIITLDSEEEINLIDYVNLSPEEAALVTGGRSGILETEEAFLAYAPVRDVGWTLCAMVPQSLLMEKVETLDHSYRNAMLVFLLTAVALVLVGMFLSNRVSKSIIQPMELLVQDMQQIADGDLEHKAAVFRNDEIGDMTLRLNEMVDRLKDTIIDLETTRIKAEEMHEIATTDALTGVKSRTAFIRYTQEVQDELDLGNRIHFAIGVFDCDSLKMINDRHGHERGDQYLIGASQLICTIFQHSPVFRIGGDEFAAILKGEDYENRARLTELFLREQETLCQKEENPWAQVRVSLGIADYDPEQDDSVTDTLRRADQSMYVTKTNKRN